MKPGDYVYVYVNQNYRLAFCLAVLDDEALLEYEMPNGTTALRIVPEDRPGTHHYRNLSYRRVPMKWLEAILRAGQEWIANPQQQTFLSEPILPVWKTRWERIKEQHAYDDDFDNDPRLRDEFAAPDWNGDPSEY